MPVGATAGRSGLADRDCSGLLQACRKLNKICWFANEFAGRLTRRSPPHSASSY